LKELDFISYIEEQNGIAEALYLLEERLTEGCKDKLTVMRLLFLYWFMETEPVYLTNANQKREWTAALVNLLEGFRNTFKDEVDFNWVAGYLLAQLPGLEQQGEVFLLQAVSLDPKNPLAQHVFKCVRGAGAEERVPYSELGFEDWGMMGDYFRQIFG